MDLYMPEMDGLEVTREIIKERKGKQKLLEDTTETETETTEEELLNTVDVYIIALTASASREDRQICIGAGMNDFISKPFTMTEMKSALKTCANKRKKRRKLVAGAAATSSPPSQAEVVLEDDPMLDIEETTTTAAVV
jgi:CheY-like chemotaxis protein